MDASTTVILFWVRVPVLSEQMIWVQPSVSTAVSLRITAFRADILVTPMLSTMVTTAASPSGIAATANDTAIMNVSSSPSPLTLGYARKISMAKTIRQMPMTRKLRILLS